MELELFVILALIVLFLVSCCGLIQKIRENYEEDRGRVISVTQIHVPNQMYNNNAFHSGGEDLSSGVFPSNLTPPPYTEYIEPPPRYEDLLKDSQCTVIQMTPSAGGTTTQTIFMTQTTESTEAQNTENQTRPSRSVTAH
ncbi:hypothetical protein ILUMI_22886 [Ignelater luminosus]|uniref:Uncharacterized protein n=1 Tax=Ignelater luminosus TaxID=2038154 RepID=A0A8K0CFR7_IGNLU|nr:hypothetical protein ILUMI_22886 [Ignelater luminosus]